MQYLPVVQATGKWRPVGASLDDDEKRYVTETATLNFFNPLISMIKHPLLIIGVLLSIESLVLWLEGRPQTRKIFSILPHVFWIYFLPMLASTAGLLDTSHPVYGMITAYLLPASLFLLLLPVDIRAIADLGRPAIVMMLAGILGIITGTVFSYVLFRNAVGQEFWSGFGALSASWTGGSANMIAVKEGIHTPDHVFLPMVVVDTIVPYVWMGMLVALVGFQKSFDLWNHSSARIFEKLKTRTPGDPLLEKKELRLFPAFILVVVALGVGTASKFLAAHFPEVKDVVSSYTWLIIIVSSVGIMTSFTPVRRLEEIGASRVGYFLLYFVLTSIGAKANLTEIRTALPLIAAGFLILIVHAGILLAAARLMRAPMFLVAAVSQANVGGVASAPIVAEIYRPGLASVGLLLAIFGNIIGTYAGILTAQICRMAVP